MIYSTSKSSIYVYFDYNEHHLPIAYIGPPGPALGSAGPNWEQFQSAQVPSQLEPRSVLVGTRQDESRLHSMAGPP